MGTLTAKAFHSLIRLCMAEAKWPQIKTLGDYMAMIKAPWTQEQVDALQTFQIADCLHPFTCPNDHGDEARRLIPTLDGWICRACSYTQDWAHDFMLETWAGHPAIPESELDAAEMAFLSAGPSMFLPTRNRLYAALAAAARVRAKRSP